MQTYTNGLCDWQPYGWYVTKSGKRRWRGGHIGWWKSGIQRADWGGDKGIEKKKIGGGKRSEWDSQKNKKVRNGEEIVWEEWVNTYMIKM